jgi:phosphatidylglycerophosphate synthase
VEALADWLSRPLAWFFHRGLGMTPNQVSVGSFLVSVVAGMVIGAGHTLPGLGLMALGQLLDGIDGSIARRYHLASPNGERIDTLCDRGSEAAVFLGFAKSGLAPAGLVLLALLAILLLTTLIERTGVDTRAKRVVLFLGIWLPWPFLFNVIFLVNLGGFVFSLLKADIQFQHRMDALDGDFDTVASRAALLEEAEQRAPQVHPA